MPFDIQEISVPSTDGIHTLKGVAYVPQGEIKGVFHLVHGMREHMGRYAHFLPLFAENGFVCVGYDHLGHGNTASKGEHGFISKNGGHKLLVDDVNRFAEAVKTAYPDVPYILMGHSMGSFIVRLAAAKYRGLADKLIICGTAGSNPAAAVGIMLARLISAVKGAHAYSPFIENLAFGSYNKYFKEDSPHAWLTKDQNVMKMYADDEFCRYHFTVSALADLITLTYSCNLNTWYIDMPKGLPVLLISGSEDPVGKYGRGVREVYDKLTRNGQRNVTLHIYENCRHEIHNDTCAEQSANDILEFILK